MTFIVMRSPLEEFALGQFKGSVVVARGPDIGLVSRITDALVFPNKLPADLLGGVGRCVVADDEPQVSQRLIENRLDCDSHIVLTVEDRHSDENLS